MDKTSKVFDDKWTYDTLPRGSRWLLRILPTRWFPRLHHANIEARTAYLDQIVQGEIMDRVRPHDNAIQNIRLISVGAGYDVRCSRLLSQYYADHDTIEMTAYECDLDHVVRSKQKILDRIQRRRPQSRHPTLIPMDLNDLNGTVTQILQNIILQDGNNNNNNQSTHTIFISEGVMIYLNQGVPSGLLQLCSETALQAGNTASFCFADRLENVPGGDREAAMLELSRNGWELIDFCPKPGLARHMGLARLL
ncbi:expressed unknown protein [Seminavis robusta]|uniref:S-adenosyl-L-methionine-dependent methyltransferase n=1 Tax=Seminavis robusta TaxID=568900 RepID=A0A9N8F0W9_9STRA|nr:expressed unknown protein [Seminavis robusta]|eukprot:Sro2483_g328910.1 n/a (251) ;mRNA; f:1090-1842